MPENGRHEAPSGSPEGRGHSSAAPRNRELPLLSAVTLLFFVSGFSGLVYEVTWVRMFTHVFGNTTYAVSAVLAAFMGGLALGSLCIGRFVDRRRHLLKILAALELGVGISALAMPAILRALNAVYEPLYRSFPGSTWLLLVVKVVLSFAVLLVPTFLMGGTLPALVKLVVRRTEQSGSRVAVLYALNTLGATLGCFLTGFWFIEAFGVTQTIRFAALTSLLLAAAFLLLGAVYDTAGRRTGRPPAGPARSEEPPSPRQARLLLLGFALAGFVALSLEVLWTRLLVFELDTTVYAFSIMLTTFLAGIGLGSLAYSAIERLGLIRHRYRAFGLIESAIGLLGLLSILLFGRLESLAAVREAVSWRSEVGQKLFLVAAIMIVPTLLMGAAFPLVNRIYSRSIDRIGSSVGRVYAVNTVGSILGALLTGFLILRVLDTQASLTFVSLIALGVGSVILATQPAASAGGARSRLILLSSFWVVALVLVVATPSDYLFQYYNVVEKRVNSRVEILYAHEGVECVTTVHRYPDGRRVISTGSINVAGTGISLRTSQKLQAHVPMLFHPHPKSVLQVGFGSGETSHIVTTYDTEQLDVVEISRGVLETSSKWFADINHGVVDHPKFRAIIMDGANYLALTDRKYDAILNDSTWPYFAGSSSLYTEEYLTDGKEHLNPGGIMTSWLPLDMPVQSFKSLLNTYHSVFPHVSLWMPVTHTNTNVVILGSSSPLSIDLPAYLERFERYAREDLAVVHLDDPAFFLDSFKMDETKFADLVAEAPLHTLDHPVLEFAPRRKTGTDRADAYRIILTGDPVLTKLVNLDAVGGETGRFAETLRAMDRASRLLMQGLVKRDRGEPDFARQFELALQQWPQHPGGRLLLDEVRSWQEIRPELIEQADFNDLLRIGDELLSNNNLEQAVETLTRAVELRPDSAFARHNLALAWLRQGRPDRALAQLNEALRREPDFSPAYKLRGTVHSMTGNPAAAVADLSRAIELEPQDAEAWVNRGLALIEGGELSRALGDIDRAIELDPTLAEAWYARGGLYEAGTGRPEQALSAYTRAIELDPTHLDALYNRAMLHARAARYAPAIEDLTRVIELSPAQADAYYNRGLAFRLSGDATRARQDFQRAARLDPRFAAAASE